ncbi:MAG: lamin tail domain-containing protein [Anaerolineae bacterium]|nr:lamin tail domain-containing protein [Anaerolineae bacterium]
MSFRRMVPFLLLNILVSAAVVLVILYWWDGRDQPVETDTMVLVTVTPTGVPPTLPASQPVQSEEAGQDVAETAVEEDGPTIHVVASGETLGTISQRYDVTVEDIMVANQLDNANFLSVGQELIIPIGGLAEATAVPTETPAPNTIPTPIPTAAAPEQGEANVEISGVVGVGELTEEAIQIINSGTRQVGLVDWTISDESGFVYKFKQVTLFGEGAGILVHTEAGKDDSTDLYWGLELPILVSGKTLTLTDAEGNVVSTFTVP